MNPSEIDEALRTDERIEPSPAFAGEVMHAVHARAASGQTPGWLGRAVWPVVAVASVAVALLVAVTFLTGLDTRGEETIEIARWLSIALTGTLAVAWRVPVRRAT